MLIIDHTHCTTPKLRHLYLLDGSEIVSSKTQSSQPLDLTALNYGQPRKHVGQIIARRYGYTAGTCTVGSGTPGPQFVDGHLAEFLFHNLRGLILGADLTRSDLK